MALPPPPLPFLIPFLLFLPLPCMVLRCKASAVGGLSPTSFPSQTPDACLRAVIEAPLKTRSHSLHLELRRDPCRNICLHFYVIALIVLADVPLRTFLDLNTIYILIE